MKNILYVLLIFVFSITVYGQKQTRDLKLKIIDEKINLRTVTKAQIDSFYYDLKPVYSSNMQIYIRISLPGQNIDLFTIDNKNFDGVLTNLITEYSSEKQKNEDYEMNVEKQVIFEKIPLNNNKVESVINSLIRSGQIEIPTDSLIRNWNKRFLDCSSIYFQYKIMGQFKTQSYYCPWSQNDTVTFKDIIIENYNLVKSAFNLDSLYNEFENNLPKDKYYSVDGYLMKYIMTNQQSEYWTKSQPRRDLLKLVKDTIDDYINAKLKNQIIELKSIHCFEDYQLIFGANGALKKVTVLKYDRPRLKKSLGLGDFLADKREVRKCKTKIRKIFKEMDLSFINSGYEIYRTFTFNNKGEFHLIDNTIY